MSPRRLLPAALLALGVGAAFVITARDAPAPVTPAAPPPVDPGADFTDWGWPLPYAPITDDEVAWLKSKGWWPLQVGFFADVPGYSAHYAAMRELDLLGRRGIEAEFISFLSGPPILEAFIAGQTQLTHYGDFPFWNTVDKGNPAVAIAVTGVNNEAALLVPPDSPLTAPSQLGADGTPSLIGTTLGSYCEFYISALAEAEGLAFERDYSFAGMSMREAQLVPRGVDAVAVWDPHITFALAKGFGRRIDQVYPWYFATGFEFLRSEIAQEAPGVARAIAEAILEAVLYARHAPDQVADWYRADPRIRGYDRGLIRGQIDRYLTLYKPTYKALHADFWAAEDERVVRSQHEKGRLRRAYTAADLQAFFAPEFMDAALETAGFARPARPVFLPAGWSGVVGQPPYPTYDHAGSLEAPQPWPEAGDLLRPWTAGGVTWGVDGEPTDGG